MMLYCTGPAGDWHSPVILFFGARKETSSSFYKPEIGMEVSKSSEIIVTDLEGNKLCYEII